MGFWCFFVLSSLRLNISLAIVAMVNWTEVRRQQGINVITYETCHYVQTEERPEQQDGPFIWNTPEQGHILGSYFYGLAATQLLGGRLSELFSAKWVLLMGTLIATICTFLVPVAAADDPYFIILLQIFKGLGQGILMPSFSVLMSKWIPEGERVRFLSFIASGMPVGGFLTVVLSGVICKLPTLGWSYVFYIFGALSAVWCVFWMILIYDSPLSHPHITRRELNRIMSQRSQQKPILHLRIPLKSILTSKPVWAYGAVRFASFWALSLYVSVIPLFMGTILKFDIEQNGTMSAIPNLVEAFFLICSSLVSDYLLKRKILSATIIRKIFISTGLLGYAVCMIAVTFTGCNRPFSVFFLVSALGMCGFNFASTAVVPVDMSPRFAGSISGIMNTFGAMSGIIIPAAIGYLTKKRQTMDEWSIMFYLSAAICIIATLIFLVYGSSEKQPWNNPPVILPADPERSFLESENSDKSTRDTLNKEENLQKDSVVTSENDNSSNQAGPSSQSELISGESKQQNERKESEENRGESFLSWIYRQI